VTPSSIVPKRILLATTVPITIEAFLIPLVDRLAAGGWQVEGMAHRITESPARRSFHRVWDVEWSRSPVRTVFKLPVLLRQIRRVLMARHFEVVHVQTPVAALVIRLALATIPSAKRPAVVYTAHGFHFHPEGGPIANAIALALERLAAKWTDLLLVTNAVDLAAARRHSLLPPDRIRRVPGVGVDVTRFRRDQVSPSDVADIYTQLGVPIEKPLIVCVAELNKNKNQSLLVRALSRMKHRNAHVVMRGEGPTRSMLERLATKVGVEDRVHFLGFQRDTRPLLVAARVLTLVSHREGLPRVVMEGLCLEVPVVGTDIRGIRDLVADVGTLVPPNDESALARALDGVLADPASARARSVHGRRRMEADYALSHVLEEQMALYEVVRRVRSDNLTRSLRR